MLWYSATSSSARLPDRMSSMSRTENARSSSIPWVWG